MSFFKSIYQYFRSKATNETITDIVNDKFKDGQFNGKNITYLDISCDEKGATNFNNFSPINQTDLTSRRTSQCFYNAFVSSHPTKSMGIFASTRGNVYKNLSEKLGTNFESIRNTISHIIQGKKVGDCSLEINALNEAIEQLGGNGDKDTTAVLHLALALLQDHHTPELKSEN